MFCGDDRKLPHIVYPSLILCEICKHNVKKHKGFRFFDGCISEQHVHG